MITIDKEFLFEESYPLSNLGKREELLFFDIETTGFSGEYNQVYLSDASILQKLLPILSSGLPTARKRKQKLLTLFLHLPITIKPWFILTAIPSIFRSSKSAVMH